MGAQMNPLIIFAFTLLICKVRCLESLLQMVPSRCNETVAFVKNGCRAYNSNAIEPCIFELGGNQGPELVGIGGDSNWLVTG